MKHRKGIYLKTAPQKETDETVSSDDESEKSSSKTSEVWLPESNTAFRLLMSANLCSALLNNITDCDETYNYWEPLHHLITDEGFQTWEYSPTYAIRSWGYIYLHYMLTWIHMGFLNNKLLTFYFIRMILGLTCTLCEVQFFEGVSLRFGNNVARLVLGFLLFGSGMFISATAFLPSSFCMYMTLLFFGSWMKGNLNHALLAVAAGAILAWPFSVALGIPLAVDIVIRRQKYFFFFKWCAIALITMQLPCVIIDSYYYAKTVFASINILLYNVFSTHGPDIYGVEPFSYYMINGFLNFNIVFILALLSFIVIPISEMIIKSKFKGYQPPTLLLVFTLSTLLIWFGIFFTRPHKEERFLFPVYPLICLAAALCIATVQKLYCVIGLRKYLTEQWMTVATLVIFALLSLSRSFAVFQGYHGSMDLYPKMHQLASKIDSTGRTINVCIGKEWHRFPSSFFLPENFKLQFIESEFRGQLPQYFAAPGAEGTTAVRTNFNDQNLEEKTRYVPIDSCHFLIDFNNGLATRREPLFGNDTSRWSVVEEVNFLSAHNSTSRFFRAFFVPYFFWERNTFGKYQLLRSKTKKFKKKRSN
uniref:Mannosyltransferase n=1 Tax=Phallusia mammillata TaxID=59560 RepID=A0A6F9D6G8_9ASCI|nr:alpha-1,2-mannosyltransferase ALG9-like [Phallusia mammillata]